jgi:hypothetical protein
MSTSDKQKVASLVAACKETAQEATAATLASGQASRVYNANAKFGSKKEAMAAKIAAAKAKREALNKYIE